MSNLSYPPTSLVVYFYHRDEVNVGLTKALGVGVKDQPASFKFFGPASPFLSDREDQLPVQFTRPYYDCGRSNKWIVSATAPIFDRLPRYPYDPDVPGNSSAGIFDSIRKNVYVYSVLSNLSYHIILTMLFYSWCYFFFLGLLLRKIFILPSLI